MVCIHRVTILIFNRTITVTGTTSDGAMEIIIYVQQSIYERKNIHENYK